jgi:uncharacterized protein YdaU (DUF1376 family)
MKDPAFLFYSSDFLTGTMFMSNEQIGIYTRLLCAQHQHGAMIEERAFDSLVKDDSLIRSKFIKCDGGYYNERLLHEMSLRNQKSNNISAAMKDVWEKRKIESYKKSIESYKNPNSKLLKNDTKLIGIEDENENEDDIKNKGIKDKKEIPDFNEFLAYAKTFEGYHSGFDFSLKAKYDSWVESNWKDGHSQPIKIWKTKLRNTFTHLKPSHNKSNDGSPIKISINTI